MVKDEERFDSTWSSLEESLKDVDGISIILPIDEHLTEQVLDLI